MQSAADAASALEWASDPAQDRVTDREPVSVLDRGPVRARRTALMQFPQNAEAVLRANSALSLATWQTCLFQFDREMLETAI